MFRYRAAALAIFVLILLSGYVCPRPPAAASRADAEAGPETVSQRNRRPAARPPTESPRARYTKFSHQLGAHRLACDSCHKFPSKNWKQVGKKPGDATPDVTDYPEHASCISCHRQQFFARERPAPRICSVCHVRISPRDTARFPFPNLQGEESEFRVGFPHQTHVDIVGRNGPQFRRDPAMRFIAASFERTGETQAETSEPKSCAVCHQTYQPQGKSDEEYVMKPPKNLGDAFWLKKGTFKTIPGNHTTCFTCHSAESGIKPAPSDCNTCHKLSNPGPGLVADFDPGLAETMGITDPTILREWRRRYSAGAFRHEGGMHPTLNCTACHKVATMNTLDPRTLRVPGLSCGGGGTGCHITATADDGGILNFEVAKKKSLPTFRCAKCHIVFGKGAVPDDHLRAIQATPRS